MKLVQLLVKTIQYFKHKLYPSILLEISDEMNNRKNRLDPLNERIIWVDMEMTGLDPDTCHILEVACIVTDKYLNTVAEGPNLILHQPDEVFKTMNDWCWKHHSKSGLLQASRDSKLGLETAELELINFVKTHTPAGKCPLAGSSVYMDKLFLLKYMPNFANHFHYRIIDVSTVKELSWRWYKNVGPRKMLKHRALEDIKESINTLKYFRENIFKK